MELFKVEVPYRGRKLSVPCNDPKGITVGSLRIALAEQAGLRPSHFRLLVSGKFLSDDEERLTCSKSVLKAKLLLNEGFHSDQAGMAELQREETSFEGLSADISDLEARCSEHESAGTLGKSRAALSKEARILEERITTRCIALDAVECGSDARARRKDLILRLDGLSARVRGLGLL